jgi:hypothetical protein
MIIVTVRHAAPITYTPQDKKTRFSKMSQIQIQTSACQ